VDSVRGNYSVGSGGSSYRAASTGSSSGSKNNKDLPTGNPFDKFEGRGPASKDIGRSDLDIFKRITERYQDVLGKRRVLVLE
jgi:hypothetical protein